MGLEGGGGRAIRRLLPGALRRLRFGVAGNLKPSMKSKWPAYAARVFEKRNAEDLFIEQFQSPISVTEKKKTHSVGWAKLQQ